jgi:hypothetical protein
LKEEIDRLVIHTFWRSFVSKLKKNLEGGGVVAMSGACDFTISEK